MPLLKGPPFERRDRTVGLLGRAIFVNALRLLVAHVKFVQHSPIWHGTIEHDPNSFFTSRRTSASIQNCPSTPFPAPYFLVISRT